MRRLQASVRSVVGASSDSNAIGITLSSFLKDDRWHDFYRVAQCAAVTSLTVEQAFKELKGDLAIRPIYHQTDERIEAHIFVAFLAYCLQVTLKQRLRSLAPGL